MYSDFQLAYLIILFLVASFSLILCIRNGKKQQEFLCLYLGLTFILEFLMYIVQIYFKTTANFGFLYNAYILFCTLFFLIYFNRGQDVVLVKINNVIFFLFLIIYLGFILKNYKEVNQTIGIAFSLVYILYSLIWFYGKLKRPNTRSIMQDPKFWISCGLLFWGVFFVLRIIPRYVFDKIDDKVLIASQSFFFIVNIIFYSLFFISLSKYTKKHNDFS